MSAGLQTLALYQQKATLGYDILNDQPHTQGLLKVYALVPVPWEGKLTLHFISPPLHVHTAAMVKLT